MPGYKTHLVGGTAVFLTVYAVSTNFFSVTPYTPKELLFAFVTCLLGALFPDIDTKSVMQRIFYTLLLIPIAAIIISGRWKFLAPLSLIIVFPLLVNHRGIIHSFWFITLFPLAIPAIFYYLHPPFITTAWTVYGYFVAGALSHLVLDSL